MCDLFELAKVDGEFMQECRKVIWSKAKHYSDYAFVIYNIDGEYVDSIDPVEQIFIINDRVFIRNDMCVFETDIHNLQKLICRVEEARCNYQCDNMNYIDIEI